jgi:hypothetical protein
LGSTAKFLHFHTDLPYYSTTPTVSNCYAMLCCVVLCCVVLCCVVLCCVVLCCVALRCVALRCVALRCAVLVSLVTLDKQEKVLTNLANVVLHRYYHIHNFR